MTSKPNELPRDRRPSARGLQARLVVARSASFSLDVELTIKPATTLAVLGPNGAGKSTVVDTLAGLLAVDQGYISLGGRALDDPHDEVFISPERRGIGVVFQKYLLFDHLHVLDNIAFGPRCQGASRSLARAQARAWIEPLGLEGLEQRHPGELSGGQAQRVALARALASKPDLLLLDEPLAALDANVKGHLRRLLADHLHGFSGPRLLITHDPADAFLLADEVCVVEAGRVTQRGTPQDLRRRPASAYVAALAGVNLLRGHANQGRVTLDDHDFQLVAADTGTKGAVLVTLAPTAVALHQSRPEGSPRNTWETTIGSIEPLGDTSRLILTAPLPIMVDVTPAAIEALALRPGRSIWATVKATELGIVPS